MMIGTMVAAILFLLGLPEWSVRPITATPALHTTDIFGRPVFQYTYREAVIDAAVLYLMGIPGAFIWGVLAFVTNFIPNIGFVIGVIAGSPAEKAGIRRGDVIDVMERLEGIGATAILETQIANCRL